MVNGCHLCLSLPQLPLLLPALQLPTPLPLLLLLLVFNSCCCHYICWSLPCSVHLCDGKWLSPLLAAATATATTALASAASAATTATATVTAAAAVNSTLRTCVIWCIAVTPAATAAAVPLPLQSLQVLPAPSGEGG